MATVPSGNLISPSGTQGPPGATGPVGATGAPGLSLNMKGTVPTSASLPASGNALNDTWVAVDTGHGWTWNGAAWVDIGLFQGPIGLHGVNSFTTVTSFTVPPIGGTVNVPVADASWMVVGEYLWVDTAGGGTGQAGALQLTGKSGNTVTLLNPQPPSVIPPASPSSAGLMNATSGNASDYVGGDNACHGLASPSGAGLLAPLSGNISDYVGGDNACHPLIVPTSDYYDQDDFIAGSKLFNIGNSGAAGAVSGVYTGNYPTYPGIVQLAPGTVTANWSRAYMACPFAAFSPAMTLTMQGVMIIPTGSWLGNNQHFFGVATSPGPVITTAQSYAGFLGIASNNANWGMYTRNLAVANDYTYTTVSGSNVWHRFKIVINGATPSVTFYIDDVQVGQVSDNSLPVSTAMMYVGFWTNNSNGVNNYSMLVDAFDILVQTGGPIRFMRSIL